MKNILQKFGIGKDKKSKNLLLVNTAPTPRAPTVPRASVSTSGSSAAKLAFTRPDVSVSIPPNIKSGTVRKIEVSLPKQTSSVVVPLPKPTPAPVYRPKPVPSFTPRPTPSVMMPTPKTIVKQPIAVPRPTTQPTIPKSKLDMVGSAPRVTGLVASTRAPTLTKLRK